MQPAGEATFAALREDDDMAPDALRVLDAMLPRAKSLLNSTARAPHRKRPLGVVATSLGAKRARHDGLKNGVGVVH